MSFLSISVPLRGTRQVAEVPAVESTPRVDRLAKRTPQEQARFEAGVLTGMHREVSEPSAAVVHDLMVWQSFS